MESFPIVDVHDGPFRGDWRFDRIYRRLENNKVSFWEIGYDNLDKVLVILTGQLGGKVMEFEQDVITNMQLKNKQDKAYVDAKIAYTKKIRKGYTRDINTKMPVYKPQLAKKYLVDAKLTDLHFEAGISCQPKADGIRAISALQGDRVMMTSREGIEHEFLEDLKEEVRIFLNFLPPEVAIDGELMVPGAEFEELQSAVRGTKNKGKRNDEAILLVFDIIHPEYLEKRINILLNAFQAFTEHNPDLGKIRILKQEYAFSPEQLEVFYEQFLALGYEGMMLRKLFAGRNALFKESLYTGYRNNNLLKYKPFDDSEAVLVAIKPGKNKDKDKAIFVLEMDDGKQFTIKPGTDEERIKYLRNPKKYIGRVVTYKHQGFFTTGYPRFPTWLRFRDTN